MVTRRPCATCSISPRRSDRSGGWRTACFSPATCGVCWKSATPSSARRRKDPVDRIPPARRPMPGFLTPCAPSSLVVFLTCLFAGRSLTAQTLPPPMPPNTFSNPVYKAYLADPFCLLHDGTYYAVGTGEKETRGEDASGRVVPMLRSKDLQHWEQVGPVLVPPPEEVGGEFLGTGTGLRGRHVLSLLSSQRQRPRVPHPRRHQQDAGRSVHRHRPPHDRRAPQPLRHRRDHLPR